MIHDQIRSMLESPPSGVKAPSLDEIEDTLTAGYANALALDAERLRIERKIAEIAASLDAEPEDSRAAELATLGQRLTAAGGDLAQLRALLSSLRTRANEVRTTAA
jgi:ABC-type phosphate transport system auxiliary subunit